MFHLAGCATSVGLTTGWGPKPVLSPSASLRINSVEGLPRGLARTTDCPVLSLGQCRDIIAQVAASRNGFSSEGHRPAIGELHLTCLTAGRPPTAPPIEFRFWSSGLAGIAAWCAVASGQQ